MSEIKMWYGITAMVMIVLYASMSVVRQSITSKVWWKDCVIDIGQLIIFMAFAVTTLVLWPE